MAKFFLEQKPEGLATLQTKKLTGIQYLEHVEVDDYKSTKVLQEDDWGSQPEGLKRLWWEVLHRHVI